MFKMPFFPHFLFVLFMNYVLTMIAYSKVLILSNDMKLLQQVDSLADHLLLKSDL